MANTASYDNRGGKGDRRDFFTVDIKGIDMVTPKDEWNNLINGNYNDLVQASYGGQMNDIYITPSLPIETLEEITLYASKMNGNYSYPVGVILQDNSIINVATYDFTNQTNSTTLVEVETGVAGLRKRVIPIKQTYNQPIIGIIMYEGAGTYNDYKIHEIEFKIKIKALNKSLILHEGKHKKFNETIPSDGGKPIVPIMNNATQDGIAITVSGIDSGTGYGAFGTGHWVASGVPSLTNPAWLTVDFGMGNEKVVDSYQARAFLGDRYITHHKFQGSNNGVDFVDLFESKVAMNTTIVRYNINNDKPYRYYRFHIYKSGGSNGRASLQNVQFFEKPTPIIPYNWSTVSNTLPNSTEFLDKGMDSPLLERTVMVLNPIPMNVKSDILPTGEEGKVFTQTVDLKKYLDLREIEVR